MRINAIIVAGGSGRRLGSRLPKQFVEVAGSPVLVRVVGRFTGLAGLARLIIVAREEYWEACRALLSGRLSVPLSFAVAGNERQDSVAAGVALVESDCDVVVVHDAARPFVTPALIEQCVVAASQCGAALAALPASDTVKQVAPSRLVMKTMDRTGIWLAQTPQAFKANLLKQAHARAAAEGVRATDDAALVEALGATVKVIPGEVSNIKITTPHDLVLAESIAQLPGMS